MRCAAIALMALGYSMSIMSPAEAGGMGRFLGSLLARGAVVAAVQSSGRSSVSAKSYTADVLTVAQLAQCINKAGNLDKESDRIEGERAKLALSMSAVDSSKSEVDARRSRVDRSSRVSVSAFNALIDRYNGLVESAKVEQATFNADVETHNVAVDAYNTECAKKYYADDLSAAQKMAAGG